MASYTFSKSLGLAHYRQIFSQNFPTNWTVSGLQQYRTGGLILVQAPANTLGTGVLFTQFKKANIGGGPRRTGVDRGTLDPNNPAVRWLNAASFTAPGQFALGDAAQYYGDFRQPGLLIENFSVMKRMQFPVGDRTIDLIYRADAFNMFNRTSFGGVVGAVGNPNFGRPTGPQIGARLITMGLRLDF